MKDRAALNIIRCPEGVSLKSSEAYIGQRWDEAMNARPVSPFQPKYLPPAIPYEEFLKRKIELSHDSGWEITDKEINPFLKPHQRVAVRWGVKGGRRAWFMSFGLGKTVIQLETLRIILEKVGGCGLIVAPLGVRQEFKRDAAKLGMDIKFIRSIHELELQGTPETGCRDKSQIYITNYETVREGKIDPNEFTATSLDEAACLRGFGGSKTFREFMRLFEQVKYKFVATATPSPNEYIELLAYSAYLGIMDVGGAKTRFFKRDSTKADKLTIHPHKEEEFYIWLASWALFCPAPSVFGFSDEGYTMPPMRVIHHEVKANHEVPVADRDRQMRMFRNSALGLSDAAREKRESLGLRIAKAADIVAEAPKDHWLLWHDLEDERRALEKAIPDGVSIYGGMRSGKELDEVEERIIAFSEGRIQHLLAKPSMAGSGCNFQYHCHKAVFVGIGFKFADFIQALHRILRFLQTEEVEIHLVYSESERSVLKILMEKWKRHEEQVKKMAEIIKQYGLSELALAQALTRSIGCERVEVKGEGYQLVNNDSILEARTLPDNSLGLILTSIPFSTQYEYSPSYNDFGHSESNAQFFEQMDYLTPELYRALMPGRIAAIHVKDRTVPGGMTGMGFQSAYPFHADCIYHFMKHGFVFLGMKTIVTDVVRENNQTYRMGWSEQCKDATKMGYGMPEYLLCFRKPQTDRTKGYADVRVTKSKKRYSKARWQVDAHGFTRSSGDVPINPKEWAFLTHQKIFGMFHDWGLANIYDFEYHVKLGESIMEAGRLPVTFMLLQPPSWHPDVWTDITRMITVNALQTRKGKQMHLCPMQFDLADRVITQMSNPGDIVADPFGGLMTVPMRAIALGRKAWSCELNPGYFLDGVGYTEATARKMAMPTLFDMIGIEEGEG